MSMRLTDSSEYLAERAVARYEAVRNPPRPLRPNAARAGGYGYEPEVATPRINWGAVAIAAVTVGLIAGLWLGVAWLVFRRLTDG